MVEQLISEGKYEDALEYLKDKTDEDSIYQRATCLYYLEKYEELAAFCNIYLENAGKHYYSLLLLYTDCLTKIGDFDTAIDLLDEELRMPWIPMEYEDKIKAAHDYLLKQKNAQKVIDSPLNKMDDEELYALLDKVSEPYEIHDHDCDDEECHHHEHLVENKNFDIALAVECLNVMTRRNVRLFLRNIQSFFENPLKVRDLKIILLELLKDQGVDKVFKYVTNDYVCMINPMSAPNLFSNAHIDDIINIIVDSFNLKDMSILDYCKRLLVAYLVMIYPNVILEDENRYIAGALYAVAHEDNHIELDLNDVTEILKLNGSLFAQYHRKMMNVEIY